MGEERGDKKTSKLTTNSTQILFSAPQIKWLRLRTLRTSDPSPLDSHWGGSSVQNRREGWVSPSCSHKIILKLWQGLQPGRVYLNLWNPSWSQRLMTATTTSNTWRSSEMKNSPCYRQQLHKDKWKCVDSQNPENTYVAVQIGSMWPTDIFVVLAQEKGIKLSRCVQAELYTHQSSSPLRFFDSGLCTESTGLLAVWLLGRGSVIFSCFGAVYPGLLDCAFGAGLCHWELAGEKLPLQKRTI